MLCYAVLATTLLAVVRAKGRPAQPGSLKFDRSQPKPDKQPLRLIAILGKLKIPHESSS